MPSSSFASRFQSKIAVVDRHGVIQNHVPPDEKYQILFGSSNNPSSSSSQTSGQTSSVGYGTSHTSGQTSSHTSGQTSRQTSGHTSKSRHTKKPIQRVRPNSYGIIHGKTNNIQQHTHFETNHQNEMTVLSPDNSPKSNNSTNSNHSPNSSITYSKQPQLQQQSQQLQQQSKQLQQQSKQQLQQQPQSKHTKPSPSTTNHKQSKHGKSQPTKSQNQPLPPSEPMIAGSYAKSHSRKVNFKPYSLQEYKNMQMKVKHLNKLGGLGPDLSNEKLQQKKAKQERMMNYAKEIMKENSQILFQESTNNNNSSSDSSGGVKKHTNLQQKIAMEKRKRMKQFASKIPKPKQKVKKVLNENNLNDDSLVQEEEEEDDSSRPPELSELELLEMQHNQDLEIQKELTALMDARKR